MMKTYSTPLLDVLFCEAEDILTVSIMDEGFGRSINFIDIDISNN